MYQETDKEREQNRRKSVSELSDLIVSNIAYMNYLESLGTNNDLAVFCNVDKLKVMVASFMMILWKDEFIEKAKTGLFHEDFVKRLVSTVSIKQCNRWYIGNITFNNPNELIEFIRNKMAHGDYLIENGRVMFQEDNRKGYIPIDYLVDFTNMLVTNIQKMQVSGKNTNVYLNVAMPRVLKFSRMKTIDDIKKRLYHLKYIEVTDQPYPGKTRTMDYINILDQFSKDLINRKKEFDGREYEKIIEHYYKKFVKNNIDVRVSQTRAGQLPNMDHLAEKMLKNKFFREEKDPLKQLNLLAYAVYEKNDPNALKINLTEGLIINQNILYEVSANPEKSGKEIMRDSCHSPLPEKFKWKRAVIAAQMVAFYIVYIYGFDRIYNADERDHIDKIFEGKMFDFSKLDLSIMESDIPMTTKDYSFFQDQFEKNKRTKTVLMDKYFNIDCVRDDIETNLNEMIQSGKKIPSKMIKALEEQKQRLLDTNKQYEETKRKVHYESCFMEYNYEDYKINRSKVEHMRNSITHGNIKVKYIDDETNHNETIFCFKDLEDDKLTFSTKLTEREFKTLITGKNLHSISTYLDLNTRKYNGPSKNDTIIPKHNMLKRGKV